MFRWEALDRPSLVLRVIGKYAGEQGSVLLAGALAHRVLEARSLAMHCLAAQKVARDPALLKAVRRTLATWRARYGSEVPRALNEWQKILAGPWPEIAAIITDAGERATRLRQSSPFAGVLSEQERERVYAAFRS